jgi:hypothetical protein
MAPEDYRVADSTHEKKTERNEQSETRPQPEKPPDDSTIKNKGSQSTWRISQQAHFLEQDESATDLFYKPGELKHASQKFELIDSSQLRGHAEKLTAEPITSDNFKNQEISAALDNSSTHNPDINGVLQGKIGSRKDAQAPPALKNDSEGWTQAERLIAALPFDKQVQVMSAGLRAGVEQYRQEDQERQIGAIIGSAQGVGNVAVNLAKIADFSAYCIIGDKERAGAMAEEFGKAFGETTFSGIRLIEISKRYCYEVSSQGDYSKPFRDIVAVGEMLDSQWSQLPPREQERRKYELMSQMVADGLIGTAGAQAIGKAKTFTGILDTLAERVTMSGSLSIDNANRASAIVAREVGNLSREFLMPEIPEHLKHLEVQPASQELLEHIRAKGLSIRIAVSEQDLGHLKSVGASAVYRILDNGHEMVIPKGAGKIQVLEEFLHSTQRKLGLLDNPEIPRSIAEIHVKDFMIRHAKFLGLTENDLQVLKWLKQDAVRAARKAGYIWRE